jgi:hypothetical protein
MKTAMVAALSGQRRKSAIVLPTTGLLARWNADPAFVTKDGSNLASQANDQSGNGHHISQATPTHQWTWTANVRNGLPAFASDSDDVLFNSGTLPTLLQGQDVPYELWVVYRLDALPGTRILVNVVDSASTQTFSQHAVTTTDHRHTRRGSTATTPVVTHTGVPIVGNWYLIRFKFAGTTGLIRVNGVDSAVQGADAADTTPQNRFCVGGTWRTALVANSSLQGMIAEVVLYSTVDDARAAQLEAFLNGKWTVF